MYVSIENYKGGRLVNIELDASTTICKTLIQLLSKAVPSNEITISDIHKFQFICDNYFFKLSPLAMEAIGDNFSGIKRVPDYPEIVIVKNPRDNIATAIGYLLSDNYEYDFNIAVKDNKADSFINYISQFAKLIKIKSWNYDILDDYIETLVNDNVQIIVFSYKDMYNYGIIKKLKLAKIKIILTTNSYVYDESIMTLTIPPGITFHNYMEYYIIIYDLYGRLYFQSAQNIKTLEELCIYFISKYYIECENNLRAKDFHTDFTEWITRNINTVSSFIEFGGKMPGQRALNDILRKLDILPSHQPKSKYLLIPGYKRRN